MIRLSHRIMLVLMDGEPHRLGDFLGYVRKGVDPRIAIRTYRGGHHRNPNAPALSKRPLEYQVEMGTRRYIKGTVYQMLRTKCVEVSDRNCDASTVMRITQAGLDRIKSHKWTFGCLAREMRQLYIDGKLNIKLELLGESWKEQKREEAEAAR